MGVPRWSAQLATGSPGRAKGQYARSAAPTELAFMRNRSPPAADRFCLLLNGEKHVLPSSHPQCCLQRLGLSGGASFALGKSMCCPAGSKVLLAALGSSGGASASGPSLALSLRPWGLSGLECSTDLTNCLGSVLSCAHLGTAGLGLGLAGMRIAWLLCAS